jgi:hypothetical protein
MVLRWLRYYFLPFVSALVLLWLGLAGLDHLVWNIADPFGVFCSSTKAELTSIADSKVQAKDMFATNAPCFATGLKMTKGARYGVTITPIEEWKDGNYATTPSGYEMDDREGLGWFRSFVAVPLRRDYFRRWFTVVARVGTTGLNEDFLDPSRADPSRPEYYGETGRIKTEGELYLYVNEAGIALPWIYDLFYRAHHGTARVEVQRLHN